MTIKQRTSVTVEISLIESRILTVDVADVWKCGPDKNKIQYSIPFASSGEKKEKKKVSKTE